MKVFVLAFSLMPRIGGGSKRSSLSRRASRGKGASNVEENRSVDGTGTHEYWRVHLPSNELDDLMWGADGIPPPAPPLPPRFQKNWAKSDSGSDGSEDESGDDHDVSLDGRDNILSAIEDVGSDCSEGQDASSVEDDYSSSAEDKIVLEDIVWKQRSGFGRYSLGIISNEWERRRIALFESGKFRYYALPANMDGLKYDPDHATNADKSPWVYDSDEEPRGEMDLRIKIPNNEGDLGGGRRWNIISSESSGGSMGIKVQARQRQNNPGPTPYEIDVTRRDTKDMWRFCFESQSIQIEWLSTLKSMSEELNNHLEDLEDENEETWDSSEGLGANHGFRPGDHIIRWEMLPIIYPIQIHGIVLEAGKNCVIIADFGLASYANHGGGTGGLNTWSDDGKDDSHDIIMAAWEKIKPKEKNRLNVIVVTDPREIRKWSKISYGERVEKNKPGFFTSLLPGTATKTPKAKKSRDETEDEDASTDTPKEEETHQPKELFEEEQIVIDQIVTDNGVNGSPTKRSLIVESQENDQFLDGGDPLESEEDEREPEWFRAGSSSRKRLDSASTPRSFTSEGQSVFSIEKPEDRTRSKMSELPKSDSAKIVLARTHFILENEDLLPPYHVFYSNSECIAVWCKTGRWSTLQAAVYLVSSSVGFGKSATMLTLSVAAAHMILVPALAVGGLAVVGAPLLYLKMSQAKWDKATMRLTEEFWKRAKPDVFVEAIEYWGGLRKE